MIAAQEQTHEYLQILSLLAKAIKHPGVLHTLRTAKHAHKVFDTLAHDFYLSARRSS